MGVVFSILLLALMIGALIDIITRRDDQVKHLPKVFWIPDLVPRGARVRRGRGPAAQTTRAPLGPAQPVRSGTARGYPQHRGANRRPGS